jgi:DNA ligase (NAD+)
MRTLRGRFWSQKPFELRPCYVGFGSTFSSSSSSSSSTPRSTASSKGEERERKALDRTVNRWASEYYDKGNSMVSDEEYDAAVARLRDLEQRLGRPAGAGAAVGSARSPPSAAAVPHAMPMLSLTNTYDADELAAFDRSASAALISAADVGAAAADVDRYCVERKVDGLALAVRYSSDGVLLDALSRGDGRKGDRVTALARRLVADLPARLPAAALGRPLEVRGEVYVDWASLERLSAARVQAAAPPYSSARSAVAGLMNARRRDRGSDDAADLSAAGAGAEAWKPLRFVAYAALGGYPPHVRSQMQLLAWLREIGFAVDDMARACDSLEAVRARLSELDADRGVAQFATDGAVVKVNSLDMQRTMGENHRAPRWAVAFKFAARPADSVLRDVRFQVGKSGRVTPVAEFDPCVLGGHIIRRASLHNVEFVERLGVRLGGGVTVAMGGDVIPKVVGVCGPAGDGDPLRSVRTRGAAFVCPCDRRASLVRRRAVGDDAVTGVDLFCSAPDCAARRTARIAFFASRQGVHLDGFGEATIEFLAGRGLLQSLADLVTLRALPDELADEHGWGPRRLGWLRGAVLSLRARPRPQHVVLGAFGVPGLGRETARRLVAAGVTVEALAEGRVDASAARTDSESVVLAGLREFVDHDGGRDACRALLDHGYVERASDTAAEGQQLSEPAVVLTGRSASGRSRGEFADELRRRYGVRVVDSVSRAVRAVIVCGADDAARASSKILRARALGIAVCGEAELDSLMAEITLK